jgi:hypothetical protein
VVGGGAAGAGAAIGGGAIGAGAEVLIAFFFFTTWCRARCRTTRFFDLPFFTTWRGALLGATYGSSIGGAGAAIGGGAGAAIGGGGGGASFAHAASNTTIDPSNNGRTNLTTVLSLAERHHT